MAEGPSQAFVGRLFDQATGIQLHIGPPGKAGTRNRAMVADRPVTAWTSPEPGRWVNVSALEWPNVQSAESPSHFSAWANGFAFSGAVTGDGYMVGDTYMIPAGELAVVIPVAG